MSVPGGLNAACVNRQLLLYDNFSEANNTAVNGKSLDIGGTWSYVEQSNSGGTSCITDGSTQAIMPYAGSDKYGKFIASDTGHKDVRIFCDIVLDDVTCWGGFILRSNRVSVVSNSAGTLLTAYIYSSGFRVTSQVNGVFTQVLLDTSQGYSLNTSYSLQAIVKDTTLTFITPLKTYTCTVPSSTNSSHGFILRSGTTSKTTLKNFRAETL